MSNVVYRGPILGNCSNFDDSLSLWLFTSLTKDTDLTGVDSTKIEDNEYQLSFEALIFVFLFLPNRHQLGQCFNCEQSNTTIFYLQVVMPVIVST
jgi:hypothetical protein